jgi:hypothetical protein
MINLSSIPGLLFSLLMVFSTAAANAFFPHNNLLLADTVKPVITLSGGDTVSSERWYHYSDPGYSAFDSVDGNLDSFIVVVSNVDTANTGYYLVTYDVSDVAGNAAVQRQRVVHITPDVTKPVITLTGGTAYLLSVYSPYNEPGYSATDYYNKDLDSLVQVSGTVDTALLGTYPVNYEVTDAAGNKTTVKRDVAVSDTSKPVIKLKGNSFVIVCRWHTFIDSGAEVTDNYYKGMTANVTSTVNTLYEGLYYVEYKVTDPSGNVAKTVARLVEVVSFGCDWGIEEFSPALHLKVYPNPSAGIFNINTVKPIQAGELKIFNSMGQEVSGFTLHSSAADGSYMLDMSGSPVGAYFIRIGTAGEIMRSKVTIVR